MRKLSFFLILGTLLFSFITLGIDEASASCAPSPFAGQWVNDSNEPSLVKRVEITIPCTDTFDQGIGGTDDYAMPPANLPMFYTIALCQSGDCVWGWSPGRRDGNNYADRRHWINATTDQTFQALPDGKLRVTTTVNFNNGTRQVFTDILHRISSKMQGAVPELFVITSFKVLTATPDGDISAAGGANEFRPRTWFTRGKYKFVKSWFNSEWIPLSAGSVDAIFQLKESDPATLGIFDFNGKDDHFDINPSEQEKDIHIRIYLEAGVIYTVQNGQLSYLGKTSSPIELEGYNGEDRARVEILVTVLHFKEYLTLPRVRAVSTELVGSSAAQEGNIVENKNPTSSNVRREAPTSFPSEITLPASSPSCQRPNIVEFYAGPAPEGSTASFRLYYKVEGADRVEIFGNVLEQHVGAFDRWIDTEDTSHEVIWAKVDGTPDNCYAEKGIYVTPGAVISSD